MLTNVQPHGFNGIKCSGHLKLVKLGFCGFQAGINYAANNTFGNLPIRFNHCARRTAGVPRHALTLLSVFSDRSLVESVCEEADNIAVILDDVVECLVIGLRLILAAKQI